MDAKQEVRDTVNRFLDRVADYLRGIPPDEKRDILKDLESHIYEKLGKRVEHRKPTPADVSAVLAEMDPPESYGQRENEQGTSLSGKQKLGIAALSVSLGTLLLAALVFFLVSFREGGQLAFWMPFFLFLGGQIAGIVLGVQSWGHALGKAAVITSSLLLAGSLLVIA